MKRLIALMAFLAAGFAAMGQELVSPDGNLRMRFSLDKAGTPTYELFYGDQERHSPEQDGIPAAKQRRQA